MPRGLHAPTRLPELDLFHPIPARLWVNRFAAMKEACVECFSSATRPAYPRCFMGCKEASPCLLTHSRIPPMPCTSKDVTRPEASKSFHASVRDTSVGTVDRMEAWKDAQKRVRIRLIATTSNTTADEASQGERLDVVKRQRPGRLSNGLRRLREPLLAHMLNHKSDFKSRCRLAKALWLYFERSLGPGPRYFRECDGNTIEAIYFLCLKTAHCKSRNDGNNRESTLYLPLKEAVTHNQLAGRGREDEFAFWNRGVRSNCVVEQSVGSRLEDPRLIRQI